MSRVTSYWVWGDAGQYYGMPLSNLAGWAITGFVLLASPYWLAPRSESSLGFAMAVYLVNFSLPLGFCVLNHYWLAVFVAVACAGIAWLALGSHRSVGSKQNPTRLSVKTHAA
jgi:uncharacterized membrane protein